MAENEFILSPLVTKNFDEKSRKKFLVKYRLYSEYSRSGQDFHFFVQENIQNGRIDKNDLAQYLFEELLYGNQRLIHMYDLYSYNDSYKNGAELISRIQTYYSYVDSLPYNQILFQNYNHDIGDLVATKYKLSLDLREIQNIVLIFSDKCTVIDHEGEHSEYSYTTAEIDFSKKLLFIKVEPKSNIIEENKKPMLLLEKYYEKISKILELKFNDFRSLHKCTLCNMNIELYQQIYKEMVRTRPSGIDDFINDTANNIISKSEISDYEIKVAENNVFNIHDILQKMVEHILITNILYESNNQREFEDVQGYVTYIKFSDGTNISARLKSEKYVKPIFASETFMALRSSIENAKQISELKVYWFYHFAGLRVSYDATNLKCLEIRLYKYHEKGEFDYAISKYKECEYRTRQKNNKLLAMEA